jgi:transcriptional regulator of acetoin/glycerol metabolism
MSVRRDANHADQVWKAVASNEAARSPVVASWRRSASFHALDPGSTNPPLRLPSDRIAEARQRVDLLMRVARVSLDRLFLAVGGVGCSVLLADREGVVLDRRGSAGDDATFDSWGLWTGAVWSEHSEGTNGIGTCLVEQRALTIHRDQHFLSRNALLSCTTAPIFNERGELAAALDVSSCRADVTEGFVQLIATAVSDAAQRIEAENFRLAFPEARILLAPANDRGGTALLAVDSDDLVVGATRGARLALGLTSAALARPLPVSDVIAGAPSDRDTIDSAERAVLLRALARASGNVSEAARSLGVSRSTLHRRLNDFGLRRDG